MNKLAKLRRHASQVHFSKIHFGTSITLHSATNVRVGQYDHCNVNAWLVVKTKLHCQESCWKSFSALSGNGKCDLRLKLNFFSAHKDGHFWQKCPYSGTNDCTIAWAKQAQRVQSWPQGLPGRSQTSSLIYWIWWVRWFWCPLCETLKTWCISGVSQARAEGVTKARQISHSDATLPNSMLVQTSTTQFDKEVAWWGGWLLAKNVNMILFGQYSWHCQLICNRTE